MELKRGEWKSSQNKDYLLVMGYDGNLVLSYYNGRRIIWQSNTTGYGDRLVMGSDGNLVIYDNKSYPVWQTNTSGWGDYTILKYNGNLAVVVHVDTGTLIVWSTVQEMSN